MESYNQIYIYIYTGVSIQVQTKIPSAHLLADILQLIFNLDLS